MANLPAWMIVDEIKRRKSGPLSRGAIRNSLQEGFQRDVFDCEARNAAIIAPRSIGKTWALATKAVAAAADGLDVAYVAKTEKSLRNYAWSTIQGVSRRTGIPCKLMATDFYINVGSKGGQIRFFGGDNARFIDNLRGTRWHLIIVDESGHFFSDLEKLVMQVLIPCLFGRENAQLVLSGTPNLVPSGFFYEITRTGRERRGGWNVIEEHDPFYSEYSREHVREQLELVKNQYGPGWKDLPWVQREYFARWTIDTDALVYKYQPKINSFRKIDPRQGDTRILAVSSRFKRRTGLVEAVCNRSRYDALFVTRAWSAPHGYDEIDRIIPCIKQWQTSVGGKVVVNRSHGSIALLLHQSGVMVSRSREIEGKDPELQGINAINADLRTSRVLIKTIGCEDLVEEMTTLDWERDEMGEIDESGKPDRRKNREICDALTLAWLESDPRLFGAPKKDPKVGTAEWYESEEWKHRQHKLAKAAFRRLWGRNP
jgi:hypothetical protein